MKKNFKIILPAANALKIFSLAHHKEMYKVPELLWPGKSAKYGLECVICMYTYGFEWVIEISLCLNQSYIYTGKKNKTHRGYAHSVPLPVQNSYFKNFF